MTEVPVKDEAVPVDIEAPAAPPRQRRLLFVRLAALVVLTAVGYAVPAMLGSGHEMTLALNGVIAGLTALSVGFLLDRLGWVSFGGASFAGGASYLLGVLCVSAGLNLTAAALLVLVSSVAFAFLVGLVFVRSKALVFTMLTLALGQLMLQAVSLERLRDITGGTDGIIVAFKGSLFGMSPQQLADPRNLWFVAWTVTMLAVVAVTLINNSRLGRLLRAIRENETRLQHSGFGTYLPKLIAFAFSGLLGAMAGILQTISIGFVSPDVLSFGASGNAIVSTLIGGFESPLGPILGGFLLTIGQDHFGSSGELYLYTGIAVVAVLVVFPRGIAGLVISGARLVARRGRGGRSDG